MNILLVIPTSATPGGTQKLVADLGRLLAERHQVVECSFDTDPTTRVFDSGNRLMTIGCRPGRAGLARLFQYARLALRLNRLQKKHAIDVVVSFLWAADLVSRLALSPAKRVSVCVVNIEGNYQNQQLLTYRWLVGLVYRGFDKIVAINRDLASEITRLFHLSQARVETIYPFIGSPAPGPVRIELPGRRRRIGWLGRLNPIKNLTPFVELMPRILARVPSAQLLAIGEGPEHATIAESAKRAGLSLSDGVYSSDADVVLLGFVDDPHAHLAQCDVFALTSRSEGFGLALAEAMSLGLPVLASDCPTGGPHHILEGKGAFEIGRSQAEETKHGFLLPVPSGPAANAVWEEAIVRMLTDEALRLDKARGAKRRAVAFSKETLGSEWLRMIDAL